MARFGHVWVETDLLDLLQDDTSISVDMIRGHSTAETVYRKFSGDYARSPC